MDEFVNEEVLAPSRRYEEPQEVELGAAAGDFWLRGREAA
jgi:hypothetical protein